MRGSGTFSTHTAIRVIAASLSIAVIIAIVWADIASGVWQETVILSGIAAGLLTFPLTALFLERWLARVEHKKWQPVTRLALTDILHAIADDEHSDIHRQHIVPRSIRVPDAWSSQSLHNLMRQVVHERNNLTHALARWSGFLAGSADVQGLMNHIANLAEELDDIRDAAVEADTAASRSYDTVIYEINSYNRAVIEAIDEIERLLEAMTTP